MFLKMDPTSPWRNFGMNEPQNFDAGLVDNDSRQGKVEKLERIKENQETKKDVYNS